MSHNNLSQGLVQSFSFNLNSVLTIKLAMFMSKLREFEGSYGNEIFSYARIFTVFYFALLQQEKSLHISCLKAFLDDGHWPK